MNAKSIATTRSPPFTVRRLLASNVSSLPTRAASPKRLLARARWNDPMTSIDVKVSQRRSPTPPRSIPQPPVKSYANLTGTSE